MPPRFSLALTFLDYPTVLLHGGAQTPHAGGGALPPLAFGGGKSCIIHADGGELLHVAQQVRSMHAFLHAAHGHTQIVHA